MGLIPQPISKAWPLFGNLRCLFLLLLSIVTGCAPTPTPPPSEEESIQLHRTTLIDSLRRPWSMCFLSENDILLTEKDGDLLLIDLVQKTRIPIEGIPEDRMDSIIVDTLKHLPYTYPHSAHGKKLSFNGGLFEVRLDPEFAQNRWVYLSYVSQHDDRFTTKIIRGQLRDHRLEQIDTLLTIHPYVPGLFHFGGGMSFGPDGKLYITVGERLFTEGQQPPMPIAQDLRDARGKIYRLNPDGSIPEDNPDFGPDAPAGMFAVGIRAAQGIAVHPGTGDLWFTEHGTHQGDELNRLQAGANYGWPVKTTGTYRGPNYAPPPLSDRTFTDPIWHWKKTVAPTGLCFYRGAEFPEWKDQLLIPGLSSGSLWRFVLDGNTVTSAEELFTDERIRSRKVAVSPAGQIYQLTDEAQGRLILISRQTNF